MKTSTPPLRLALLIAAFVIPCCRFFSRMLLSGCLASLGSSFVIAQGGSLTPPGIPSPTMKTLDRIQPRIAVNSTNTPGDSNSIYKISQPGSYYLTGNITGAFNKISIEIAANQVTLDLMGFMLTSSVSTLGGIKSTVNSAHIAIHNGTIRSHNVGIDLSLSDDVLLSDLRLVANSGGGIKGRLGATITNCTVSSNLGTGILVQDGAVITGCTVQSNDGFGISTATAAVVSNCGVRLNGTDGVSVSSGSIVSDTASSENSDRGIVAGDGCTILNCAASSNSGDGFNVGKDCTVSHCTAHANTANGDGIEVVGEGTAVLDCTSYSNTGYGVLASNLNATVSGCTVYKNSQSGISIGAGAVTRCASFGNNFDGIRVAAVCRVTENICAGNGPGGFAGAGIHVTQSDCTVENNIVNSNDDGIDVDSSPSLIIHNTARGNGTNYNIVAGNVTGTIITNAASMNAATNTYGNLSY